MRYITSVLIRRNRSIKTSSAGVNRAVELEISKLKFFRIFSLIAIAATSTGFQNCSPVGFKSLSSTEQVTSNTDKNSSSGTGGGTQTPTMPNNPNTPHTPSPGTPGGTTPTPSTPATPTPSTPAVTTTFVNMAIELSADLINFHRSSDISKLNSHDVWENQTVFPLDIVLKERNSQTGEKLFPVDRKTLSWSISKATLLGNCAGETIAVSPIENRGLSGYNVTGSILYSGVKNKNVQIAQLFGGIASDNYLYRAGNLTINDTGGTFCPVSVTVTAKITEQTKALDGTSLSRHANQIGSYTVTIHDMFDVRVGLFDQQNIKSYFDASTPGVARQLRMQKVVAGTWQFVDDQDGFNVRWCQICTGPGSCPYVYLNNPLPTGVITATAKEIDISCWVFKDGIDRWVGVNESFSRQGLPYYTPSIFGPGSPK